MLSSEFDLVLSEPGVYLGRKSNRIAARSEGKTIRQIPFKKLKHIVVLCNGITFSSNLIEACAYHKIPIDFVDYRGVAHSRLSCPHSPISDFGLKQIQAFGNGKAVTLAKGFIEGKIKNQLNTLKYFSKYRGKIDLEFKKNFELEKERIKKYIQSIDEIEYKDDYELFRGQLFAVEGLSASSYWNIISCLLKDKAIFTGRVREGATDVVNVLLNYGYGILYTRIWGAVQNAGLNPFISFLHAYQKGKPTLVYDAIEEFRAPIVDRTVIALLSKGEIKPWADKETMPAKVRRKLAEEILQRMYMPAHYRGKSVKTARIIQNQMDNIRKFLENDAASYQPYLCKW